MDTKEKTQAKKAPASGGKKAPARQRPAGASRPSDGKAPARPKPSQPAAASDGDYEVYIPDAQSQQDRHGTGDERLPRPAGKTPARRSAAPAKGQKKQTSRNQEAQYRPYRQANQRSKAMRRKSFRDSLSKFFSY